MRTEAHRECINLIIVAENGRLLNIHHEPGFCVHYTTMKRTIAGLSLILVLAGCGGSTTTTAAVTCKEQYWDGTIGLCLPDGWKVMDSETLRSREVGEETIAAFQADQATAGQFPVLTVTREILPEAADSAQYSDDSIRKVKASVLQYKLIDMRNQKVDEQDANVHIFSGQTKADSPERRFAQMSVVSGDSGFTISARTPLAASDTLQKQILLMFGTVTFKAPQAAAQ